MRYLNTGQYKRIIDLYLNWYAIGKYAFKGFSSSHLNSANLPAPFGIVWYKNDGSVTEGVEASASNSFLSSGNVYGDVVNVNFYVFSSRLPVGYYTTGWNIASTNNTMPDYEHWRLIGKIKKSRDISNRHYKTGAAPQGHRFTIDYSELVQDELSYSLCPINRGTWRSHKYGGMNGGLQVQDNVIAGNSGNPTAGGYPVSDYNVTKNGSYAFVRIAYTFDIIDANGFMHETEWKGASNLNVFINSTPNIGEDGWYYRGGISNSWFAIGRNLPATNNAIRCLTNCPNHSFNLTIANRQNNHVFNKPVRMLDQAEFLQFNLGFPYRHISSSNTNIGYQTLRIKIETFTAGNVSQNVVYVDDFTDTLTDYYSGGTHNYGGQYDVITMVINQIQNISPTYVNNNGKNDSGAALTNQITSTTVLYSCHVEGKRPDGTEDQLTDKYYYEIDREETNQAYYLSKPTANRDFDPVEYVRFHWLNRMGGIDSYTAKRDVVESLSVSRDTITRKNPRVSLIQQGKIHDLSSGIPLNDTDFINDTMRGGDFYKGGREVLNVNAERAVGVYTDPLQKRVAKWLEELITSPNVWVEKQTEAAQINNSVADKVRPAPREYIPIIITNSDITTVDQSQGLVKFNIEFVYSFGQNTQRN